MCFSDHIYVDLDICSKSESPGLIMCPLHLPLLFFPQALGSVSFQCFHQRTLSASSSQTAQLTCYAAPLMIAILGIPPVLVGAVAASTGGNCLRDNRPLIQTRGLSNLCLLMIRNFAGANLASYLPLSTCGLCAMVSASGKTYLQQQDVQYYCKPNYTHIVVVLHTFIYL